MCQENNYYLCYFPFFPNEKYVVTNNTICCMKEESLWKAPAPTSVEAAYGANNTTPKFIHQPQRLILLQDSVLFSMTFFWFLSLDSKQKRQRHTRNINEHFKDISAWTGNMKLLPSSDHSAFR